MLKISKAFGAKKNLKYKSHIQNDFETEQIRKILDNLGAAEAFSQAEKSQADLEELKARTILMREKLVEHNYLHSIRQATHEEKKYECVGYVLAKTLGFKHNIMITLEISPLSVFNPFKYFKQTSHPQPHDIVIYSTSEIATLTSHMGIFLDNDHIESKWGNSSDIVVHKLFNIPMMYGDYACFFTLKNKFRKLPKELLINLILYDITTNTCDMQRKLRNGLIEYYGILKSKNILLIKTLLPMSTLDIVSRQMIGGKK